MSQQEKEYYRAGNVLITNARAEMGGRTFAMANVTAVSMATAKPSPGCAFVLLALGALVGIAGLASIADGGIVALAIGVVIAAVGFAWLKSLKPAYSVNLGSASGESRAMQSQNREEIEQIVDAIKRAIVERS